MLKNLKKSQLAIMLTAALSISACGGGSGGGDAGGGKKPDPGPTDNTAPTISGTPVLTVNENEGYSFKPSASDAENNSLTFSVAGNPNWLQINSSTGELSGTPGYDQAGEFSNIVISVSDGSISSSLAAFNLTVNDVFTISGTNTGNVDEAQSFSFMPTMVGTTSGDTYTSSALPAWLSLNPATGELTGTPGENDSGVYEITINASNGINQVNHVINITVNDTIISESFTINGKVIDGYISGANVFVDFNNNMTHDAGEPNDISSAVGGEEGSFSILVASADVSKLSRANLVAEIGSGLGINADDVSRSDDDFQLLPLLLLGQTMNEIDVSAGEYSTFITPFTHLVQQLVNDSAVNSGKSIAELSDFVIRTFINQAKSAVGNEEQVDVALALSDFIAADISASALEELTAKAKTVVEYIQDHTNDSDNDGFFNFEDDFPFDDRYQKDTDGDQIADQIDDDIDGDGLLNDNDYEEYVYNEYKDIAPAPNANINGYDLCVSNVVDNSLLCLTEGEWEKPTEYLGRTLTLTSNTITRTTYVAIGQSSCILTNNKVYCVSGDLKTKFEEVYGVGNPAFASNPTNIVTGSAYMCYLDDFGVKCLGGSNDEMPQNTEQPEMTNITQLISTAGTLCTLADEGVQCWGSTEANSDYDIKENINAEPFNQPKALYSTASVVCVEDADGLQCYGDTSNELDLVSVASTSIKSVELGASHVCVIDDAGEQCFGQQQAVEDDGDIVPDSAYYRYVTTVGDVYDSTGTELLLDLTFEQTELLEIRRDGYTPILDENGDFIYDIVYEPETRVNWALELEPELDDNGDPVLDEDGEPLLILVLDENGNSILVLDESGDPVIALNDNDQPIQVFDENGEMVIALDENGDPIMLLDINGNPIRLRDADGGFVYTDIAIMVNVPQELNPNSMLPELFDELLHTRPRSAGPLELPESVGSIETIALGKSLTCLVDQEGVNCINETQCKITGPTPSRSIDADPEGAFWECLNTETYDMDKNFDSPIKALNIQSKVVCAFSVGEAFCEAGDDSFVGDVPVP